MSQNESAINWNKSTDVVVIGSGGAGLTAALSAAKSGANVLVLEKSNKLGGNTSISGGQVWVPNNHHMLEEGLVDSEEAACAYLERVVDGTTSKDIIDVFVKQAPEAIKFIEKNSPLSFHSMTKFPDYRQEFQGSVEGGRTLDPDPIEADIVGEWADLIHEGPHFTAVTYEENSEWNAFAYPENIDFDLIADRIANDVRTLGGAIIVGLVKGCLDAGVELEVNAAVKRLVKENGRITGVEVTQNGETRFVEAKNGVVIASGGFEFNEEMMKRFLRGPINGPIGVPTNTGDGLKMVLEVGADVAHLNEAWWAPTIKIDGEEFENAQVYRLSRGERSLPGSIMVNRAGKRFVNEAANYNDMAKAFHFFDATKYEYSNLPAWIIFDSKFREKYSVMTLMPGDPDPDWLVKANTLQELSAELGIDGEQLEKTVARFNEFAKEGKDPDFQRGASKYDSYYGDPKNKPNAGLGPINQGPFYALLVHSGTLGTKGGPVTDGNGQVLNVWGDAIPGLYAAGNAAASMTGPGYPGAGGTLGPAMTFGYIAGKHVTTAAKELQSIGKSNKVN